MNKTFTVLIVTGLSLLVGTLWLSGEGFLTGEPEEISSSGLDGVDVAGESNSADFSVVVQNLMAQCRSGRFELESFEAAISNMDAEISSNSNPSQKQSMEMERAYFISEIAASVKQQLTEWASGSNSSLAPNWEANVRSVSRYLEDPSLLGRELRVATDIRWAYAAGGRSACDARMDEVLSSKYNAEIARDLKARMEGLCTQFASKRDMVTHLKVQISRLNEYVSFAEVWNLSIDLYRANEGNLPPHLRAESNYGLRIDKSKMLKYEWYKQQWLSEFESL